MKLQLFTLLAALALGTLANPVAEAEALACTDVGCYCKGAHQGQYCGYCLEVRGNYVDGNVYECAPGSRGKCCSYGPRDSCKEGRGPCG